MSRGLGCTAMNVPLSVHESPSRPSLSTAVSLSPQVVDSLCKRSLERNPTLSLSPKILSGLMEGNLYSQQQALQRDSDNIGHGACHSDTFASKDVMDGCIASIEQKATRKNQAPTNVYSRVANIIRESIEVEGCFLLDATEGICRSRKAQSNANAKTGGQWSSTISDENTQCQGSGHQSPSCCTLGFSTSATSSINCDRDIEPSHPFRKDS